MEDRRNAGESSCNCGDGTDQRVQSLMFMMMMMMMMMNSGGSGPGLTDFSTEENDHKFIQVYQVSRPEFEPDTYRLQITSDIS